MTGTPSFRTRFALRLTAFLSLALLGGAVAGLSAARAPDAPAKPAHPPEEEETNPPPATHKVAVDEPDEVGTGPAPAPRAVDFREAARDARQTRVGTLFHELAHPYDEIKCNQLEHNRVLRVVPIPDYVGDQPGRIEEPFQVTPLNEVFEEGAPVTLKKNAVSFVRPYEELALTKVDDFLDDFQKHREVYEQAADPKKRVTSRDVYVVADQALTTVLANLRSDRTRKVRVGDAWQAVEDELSARLLGVLLKRLKGLEEANDWDGAFALAGRLASYRKPEDREKIAGPLDALVKQTLALPVDEKQRAESRRRLRQLETLFPDSPAVRPVADSLEKQARDLFLQSQKEGIPPEQAAKLRNDAKAAWPGLPELRAYEFKDNKPVLRVGVRELPARMSPALAATDSDRRAVELLFEGLMKLTPDGLGGGRWEPALADGPPGMAPLGRRFTLAANASWSNGDRVTARDVADTVALMRKGGLPDRPPVWGRLLDTEVGQTARIDLMLTQGWLDPLAPMDFKVLPSGSEPDSPKFAAKPLGSGPFAYNDAIRTDEGRPCVAFTANPHYGGRPGRAGLPRIEEVHFIAYDAQEGPAAGLAADRPGRLNLLLDLTAKEWADLKEKAAEFHVRVTGPAAPNRRIYFLAANHRKGPLAKPAFRRALAHAIDRDALLDADFRAGQKFHTALGGPYPVGSWPADPRLANNPFDAVKARAAKTESGVGEETLSLKYPAGDPLVEKAMGDLAAQVQKNLGLTLTPTPLPPEVLRNAVEHQHDYDLAYYHYDFPDDVYWLGPLLDPDGGPDGENYLGYHGSLNEFVQGASRRRYFPEAQFQTRELHKRFVADEMPFIPLWQLDPLAAVHADVVTPSSDPPFDPLLVFTDVERWKLNRK